MTAQQQPSVLLVEDEPAQREVLAYNLEAEGFRVHQAGDGEETLMMVDETQPDIIILDWMMPNLSGIEVCRRLKMRPETRSIPIILLSARAEEVDRVRGLETGADDYLAKPFSVQELIARIKALFRRQQAMGQAQTDGQIQAHGLTIDPLARSVLLHGQVVDLTPREFELLYFFARHPGEVFSRLALLEQVWGYQHEGYEHTVNTHINRLRIKIEKDAAEPEIIRTVWGKGYKFAELNHDAAL